MGSTPRLMGHRITIVSFSQRTVECECGAIVESEDSEYVMVRNELVAEAFAAHRKAMAIKAGLRPEET